MGYKQDKDGAAVPVPSLLKLQCSYHLDFPDLPLALGRTLVECYDLASTTKVMQL